MLVHEQQNGMQSHIIFQEALTCSREIKQLNWQQSGKGKNQASNRSPYDKTC